MFTKAQATVTLSSNMSTIGRGKRALMSRALNSLIPRITRSTCMRRLAIVRMRTRSQQQLLLICIIGISAHNTTCCSFCFHSHYIAYKRRWSQTYLWCHKCCNSNAKPKTLTSEILPEYLKDWQNVWKSISLSQSNLTCHLRHPKLFQIPLKIGFDKIII